MVQAFLALHLENEGYGVRTAANGAEMLGALSEGTPDLIVLDLNLPDGDGLSLAQQVREHSSVPIIVATARKSHDDRMMALGLGADDYLTKPFDPRELILRVRNLLDRAAPNATANDDLAVPSPPVRAGTLRVVEEFPKPAETGTRKRLFGLLPILAVTFAAAVGILWIFPQPLPEPVFETAEAPASAPAAPAPAKPAGGAAEPEKPPALSPAALPAPEEESLTQPIAEVLGYGWALNSKCDLAPQVTWWKYKSHEGIAGYVTRKHGGDWTPYRKTWLRRMAKLQDILDRDSSAVTRTGVILNGDALARYVGQMQKRLSVITCLAGEAKAFAAAKKQAP